MKSIMFVKFPKGLASLLLSIAFLTSAQSWAQSNCTEVCNWYSTIYALCQNQNSGWGWENSANCIGRQTCGNQWGNGGVEQVCDDNGNQDAELCAAIDGRTYYSDHLYEMGLTPTGEFMGHRQLAFSAGEFSAYQSDYVVSGSYRCENGDVIASLPDDDSYVIDFADDLNSVNFAAFASDTPVSYSLGSGAATDCSLVANTAYTVDPAEEADQGSWINFDQQPNVQMGLPGANYGSSHYDCDTGALHIHRTRNDDNPINVSIENGGAAIVAELSSSTSWRFLRDEGSACIALYDPVCSVVPTNIVCVTEPCPVGEYNTFSNRCESDSAKAMFISEGECGELEGQPYYEDTGGCTGEYAPVCAAVTNIEPCLSSPCPIQEYKTFSNLCHMQIAEAFFLREGECGPNEEGNRIFDLSKEGLACPAVYAPVCAKEESGIVCITTPCDTHVYKTFSSQCDASVYVADIAWPHQACGDLEDELITEQPPVHMVTSLGTTDKNPRVNAARVENDILTVTLGYTGCSEQHFDFQVERAFAESLPVQARWAFIPQDEDFCDAALQTDLTYDLLPLKALYEEAYGTGPAIIALPGLADYEINTKDEGLCDLPFSSNGTSVTRETVSWSTGVINIACGSSVSISMSAQGVGPMETADYLNIYYSLNGGSRVALSENTNAFSQKTVSVNNLSGSTLEIFVEGRTSYADETYTVSNISVTTN